VGGTEVVEADVRIIAATNRDLWEGVANGWFREDLYFRLNVIPITVPLLKDRKGDIPLLANYFLESIAQKTGRTLLRMTQDCICALVAYHYPGNVRELQNIIQRAAIRARSPYVHVWDLPPGLIQPVNNGDSQAAGSHMVLPIGVLKKIRVKSPQGKLSYWHQGLRNITLVEIHQYLQGTHGTWFSRRDFADYLNSRSKLNRNKYKTAGVYLRLFTAKGILEHNGKKANLSRYSLSSRFANQPTMWLKQASHPFNESEPTPWRQEERKPSARVSPENGSI
jgi:DNA-binding NtrC family response regulator